MSMTRTGYEGSLEMLHERDPFLRESEVFETHEPGLETHLPPDAFVSAQLPPVLAYSANVANKVANVVNELKDVDG